jgi:hypothetical protein
MGLARAYEFLGPLEGRLCTGAAVCHPGAGKSRDPRLDGLLQSLAFALVSGLPEPDAIRATLAGGSAQKRRMTNRAKRSEIQGQPQSDVSFLPVRFAVVACGEAAPLCESPKALLDGIAGTTGFGVKATPRWFLWPAVNDATGCDPCVSKRRGQLWFPRRIRVCVRHWTPRHCLHIEPQKANEIHSHLI